MLRIKNLRMETGFVHEGNLCRTQSKLFDVLVDKGVVIAVEELENSVQGSSFTTSESYFDKSSPDIDAAGLLALPTLRDHHIHLDKGYYGGPWQAVYPLSSVAERIEEERGFLKEFLTYLPQRAEALLELIQGFGCNYFGVQVNVDPVIGLENLRLVREVLEAHSDELDYDLIAFPQHGALATEQLGLLSRALEQGCTQLGGLDPASLDKDLEGVLKMSFELARHYDVPFDIHLHDGGSLGNYEIERILHYTKKYGREGKVAISHALSLGDIHYHELMPLASRLAELGVQINTTMPISMAACTRRAMPWTHLRAAGVKVCLVNDNIHDHWSPFGTGDLLERVSRAAEMYNQVSEEELSRSYALVSGGKLSCETQGDCGNPWLCVGDKADMLLVDASCSAEAVARVPSLRRLIHRGREIRLKNKHEQQLCAGI